MAEESDAPASALSVFERLVGDPGSVKVLAPNRQPEVVVQEELPLAATLLLFGGGLTGKSLLTHLDNNDLINEWVKPEEYQHFDPTGLYRKMIDDYDLKGKEIVVISSASEKFNVRAGQELKEMLTMFGVGNVHVIDTHDPKQVDTPENLQALKNTPFLFVEGGDQKMLHDIFKESDALSIIQERCRDDKDFVFSGSSAGAMIVSDDMMYKGDKAKGFAVIRPMVDTHFKQRDRDYRTMLWLQQHGVPSLAIGLDEGAGVRIKDGKAEVYGSGPTLNELDRGEIDPKYITIMTRQTDAKGGHFVQQKEYRCDGDACVVRFMRSPTIETVVPEHPVPVAPPVLPANPLKNIPSKTPMAP